MGIQPLLCNQEILQPSIGKDFLGAEGNDRFGGRVPLRGVKPEARMP